MLRAGYPGEVGKTAPTITFDDIGFTSGEYDGRSFTMGDEQGLAWVDGMPVSWGTGNEIMKAKQQIERRAELSKVATLIEARRQQIIDQNSLMSC